MYCPNCKKKIPNTATTCPMCAQPTHTPIAGMATLRISCRPYMTTWMRFANLLNLFAGYKIHISVDKQDYVLMSKKKQIDIPVAVGTHKIRISQYSKKAAKAIKFGGAAMQLYGAVNNEGSTIHAGAAVEDLGNAFLTDGMTMEFESKELVHIPVKMAWNGNIVEDTKQ